MPRQFETSAVPANLVPLVAVSAPLGIVLLGRLPTPTVLWQRIEDFAHFPAFALVALGLLSLVRSGRTSSPQWRAYVAAGLTALCLGISVELAQFVIGRDASPKDVLTDLLGILTALSAGYFWQIRRSSGGYLSILWLVIAIVSALAAALPVGEAIFAAVVRRHQFPVIAWFESTRDLYFVEPQHAELNIREWPGAPGQPLALWATFRRRPWPGVILYEPEPDWSEYRTLIIQLANPDDTVVA